METSPVPLAPIPQKGEGIFLWSVLLNVSGTFWWPSWEGYARDSMDATSRARRHFYGELYREPEVRRAYPLRVVSVVPKGV